MPPVEHDLPNLDSALFDRPTGACYAESGISADRSRM